LSKKAKDGLDKAINMIMPLLRLVSENTDLDQTVIDEYKSVSKYINNETFLMEFL
jgi:hypothetical protein